MTLIVQSRPQSVSAKPVCSTELPSRHTCQVTFK